MFENLKINNQEYKTVRIGNQIWMAENLNANHYLNGDIIPEVQDFTKWGNLNFAAWCNYENNPKNGEKYGKLYNWAAAVDARNLAPTGWHLPSINDWQLLINFLGGENVAGGKLKDIGVSHWYGPKQWKKPNTGATNESGFSALPGGSFHADVNLFVNIGESTTFFSSTEKDDWNAFIIILNYNSAGVTININSKTRGRSIRLVKD